MGKRPEAAPETSSRQRRDARIPCQARLEARCSSWGSFQQLFTHNISRTGLFIATDEAAAIGDQVDVLLHVPSSAPLRLVGEVKHIFAKEGAPKGLGVQLVDVHDEDLQRYRQMVSAAAEMVEVQAASAAAQAAEPAAPEPEPQPPPPLPERPPQQPAMGAMPTPSEPPPAEQSTSAAVLAPEPAFEEPEGGAAKASALPPRSAAAPPPPATASQVRPPSPPPPPPAEPPAAAPTAEARAPAPPPPDPGTPDAPGQAPALRKSDRPVVALDFGTSRSAASAVVGQQVHVLKLADGSWDMPSVIGFLPDGKALVGSRARTMLAQDPSNALASPKRLLGRQYDDPEIQSYLPQLGVPTTAGPDGEVLIHARGRVFAVSQICAPIIFALRCAAEKRLGEKITEVVLTAPVSFDDQRFAALTQAVNLAGLQVLDYVDEPTAAALAHRFDATFRDVVAVYDFGGGTFDFSVVDVTSADVQVLATAGDSWLGGDDFDEALAGAVADAFWRQHKVELRHQVVQWQRLLVAAEGAKRKLSAHQEASIELEDVARTRDGTLDLRFEVDRPRFAELTSSITERSIDTCREVLELSEIDPWSLNAIYLSGGTSYIPAVRDAVLRFFGKPGRTAVPPERAVVIGAAVHGVLLQGSRITL